MTVAERLRENRNSWRNSVEPDRNFMALMCLQSVPTAWRTMGVGVVALTVGGSEYGGTSVFRLPKNTELCFYLTTSLLLHHASSDTHFLTFYIKQP